MDKGIQKAIDVAEGMDWSVNVDENDFEFEKYSPEGQDFSFSVTADDLDELIEKIQERIDDWDSSEEAYIWLDSSGHGRNGAPYDMKDVYEDMDACCDMIQMLLDELNNIDERTIGKKKLNVVCTCTCSYSSVIYVPEELSEEEAIQYAKDHIDEIPCGEFEHVGDSDEIEEEDCELEEE